MQKFKFKAKNKEGEEYKGMLEAEDKFELARRLRDEGSHIIEVETEKVTKSKKIQDSVMAFLNRVKLKEKIIFANNLSAMITAGLTLSRSLGVIKKQTKNPKLKKIVTSLIENVNKGSSFSDALAKFPNEFSQLFVAMVNSGEESGNLPGSLKIVAEQLNKSYELRRKIKGAMIYPTIIILVIIAIAALMMIFLVPTLTATFKDLGGELPMSTQFVILVSDFMAQYYVFLFVAIFFLAVMLWRFLKTKIGKRWFSFMVLHLPVIGNVSKEFNSAVTMRTISSLVSSGVGLVESLEITKKVLQNPYYKEILTSAGKEVQKGATLSSIFQREEKFYPVLVGEMIMVGEETGKLSDMMMKGALFYEGEVDAVTKNLSTVIEPVLMVLIGIAVGFFAISMIQPMYSLGDVI